MDASAARGVSEGAALRLLARVRIIHPFPTMLNVIATGALAGIALGGLPPTSDLAVLMAAMFCVQAAIGASNDYCDRDLDAQTKPFKPIARGLVEPNTALLLAAALTVAAGALTATMGTLSVAVGSIGLAAGLSYNWWLKRSVLSPIPFMIALPALPFWIWVSLGTFTADLWWLLPFGPLAGLAVHLSNQAPDIEADRGAGVRGLAHVLGVRRSIAVAWSSFALAIAFAVALGFHLEYAWALFLLGAVPAVMLLGAAIVAYAWRPGRDALQVGFGLIGIATAALAGAWLAAI